MLPSPLGTYIGGPPYTPPLWVVRVLVPFSPAHLLGTSIVVQGTWVCPAGVDPVPTGMSGLPVCYRVGDSHYCPSTFLQPAECTERWILGVSWSSHRFPLCLRRLGKEPWGSSRRGSGMCRRGFCQLGNWSWSIPPVRWFVWCRAPCRWWLVRGLQISPSRISWSRPRHPLGVVVSGRPRWPCLGMLKKDKCQFILKNVLHF